MDTILILDFGSQVTQLIARRLRAMEYHAEIVPYDQAMDYLSPDIKGIILSGGPSSVYAKDGALPDPRLFELGKPILGICYGIQVLSHMMGGKVQNGTRREYGAAVFTHTGSVLFSGTPKKQTVWMSHFDIVSKAPKGFATLGTSDTSPHAAIGDSKSNFYGVQFHLEVSHTPYGIKILENFAKKICGMRKQWTPRILLDQSISLIRAYAEKRDVVHALSGGVDSTVLALLLKKALPTKQVKNIFIDNGLLRLHEAKQVRLMFKRLKLQVEFINAT